MKQHFHTLSEAEHLDAILVKELSNGSIQAFNKLFEQYSKRLYGFGIKYLKSEEDTEEMVQEIFLKIWRNRKNIDASKSFKAYLFTIAFNEVKKFFQKKVLLFKLTDQYVANISDYSTEESIDFSIALAHVKVLLNNVPPRRRLIFELSRFENMSSKAIAHQLGISHKTVDNQISEVIRYLRKNIGENLAYVLFFFLFISH